MFERLASPGKIGKLTLKNRTVMTAASASLSQPDGTMTEAMLAYYERRAQGGVALIITEMTSVDDTHGVLFPRELAATRDDLVQELKQLADRVHPFGAKLFAQLFHPGANANPSLNTGDLLSASPAQGKKHGSAREATIEEIHEICRAFGEAARRVQLAGFDGVEVHGAHNYFLHSFLSPVTNHRTDEYGGSLENRARIFREVLQEIRAACGPDFPISVRLSLEEYIGPQGYHADTGLKVCQWLETWGADVINVTAAGTSSRLSQSMEPISYKQGWRKHLLKAVKKAVSIPVLGVAMVREPQYAEYLLEEGFTDFVGSARAFLADPDWTTKALSGQVRDINKCIACMSCLDMFDQVGHISCALEPETGYEAETLPLVKDGDDRLVVILGAGAAGLEAAWIAARRGFWVQVYEKSSQPGGQLLLAGAIPRKEKMNWLLSTLVYRCQEADVEIFCGKAPTPQELIEMDPYAILDATGARPVLPADIPGAYDSALVCTPPDIITGRLDLRDQNVVIVGSGMTGLETAEMLCDRDRNNAVTILESSDRIAPGALGSNRNPVTAVLDLHNVVFLLNRKLTRIGNDRIWFTDTQTGEEYMYPCDKVVLAIGVTPSAPYRSELEEIGIPVVRVGDAHGGTKIWHAIHEGHRAALEL